MMYQALPHPSDQPLHYFDSAEALLRMQAEGRSLAEMANIAGLTVPQILARLPLTALDPALRVLLRRSGRGCHPRWDGTARNHRRGCR